MPIYFYNTYTHNNEIFKPIHKGSVGIYSCGPTVYNYPHIGNLRAYIVNDVLSRLLKYNGYQVKKVVNITDVGHLTSDNDSGEDKVEVSAKKEGRGARDIADFYTKVFKDNLRDLNIQPPTIWARATDHIEEMIELIKVLERKGYTYILSDGVYFDSSRFKTYGKLACLNITGLRPGARIKIVKGKRNPTDFALWKFSYPKGRSFDPVRDDDTKRRQMEWSSPWGLGFPGWHIECSAMSIKYLGKHFDIHTGGVDHIGVHHNDEIAQSEAATGKKFVNYWLHNEYLVLDKEKMSKSAGTFIILKDIVEQGIDPIALRYLCLMTHYRKKMNFSWTSLRAANKTLLDIRQMAYRDCPAITQKEKSEIIEAFNHDLDAPAALSILHQKNNYNLWLEFEPILGLGLKKLNQKLPVKIKQLVKDREMARAKKDFLKADEIRIKLAENGYKVEDSSQGPRLIKI